MVFRQITGGRHPGNMLNRSGAIDLRKCEGSAWPLITTEGLIFQPCPSSLAGPEPVPEVAFPAPPFSPVKFSGLIDLVRASETR